MVHSFELAAVTVLLLSSLAVAAQPTAAPAEPDEAVVVGDDVSATAAPLDCLQEPLATTDTDSDGVADCADDDDDADGLADDAEAWLFPGTDATVVRDQDRDGVPDGADLMPSEAGDVELGIRIVAYSGENSDCDTFGPPDPYLIWWSYWGGPLGTGEWQIPRGWQRDDHVDGRASGPVSDANPPPAFVSSDYAKWPFELWEIPRLKAGLPIYDHDEFSPDDHVELQTGAGVTSGAIEWPLDAGRTYEVEIYGQRCSMSMTVGLSASVDPIMVRKSVAWQAIIALGHPVTRDDIENGPFK